MPFRLHGTVGDRQVSFLLDEGTHRVGSAADTDVCLDDATVSREHAELVVRGGRVEVTDRASRNGTWIGTRRVTRRTVMPGTTVTFGTVSLELEEVADSDATIDVWLDGSEGPQLSQPKSDGSTVGLQPLEAFVGDHLNSVLNLLASGADEARIAQAGGQALFTALPALLVEAHAIDEPESLVYSARRDQVQQLSSVRLESTGAELRVVVELPRQAMADTMRPLVEAVAAMMRVAAGRAVPGPAEVPAPPPLPEPATVVPAVRRIYEQAATVARGDVSVLIRGESGTGKEVLARYLHEASGLDRDRLVALNCAALPSDLLEAELFGVERGVATGVEARPGKFELADGGTLFLDEIADMSAATQAKILRVLQEGEVYRLGGRVPRQARCRIVAATNKDLDALREDGRFREDLYYRIASWVVDLPALRHRRDDIPNLASYFLLREARRRGLRVRGISRAAMSALVGYQWPGNVRQLANEIARAALFLADGEALDTSRLSAEVVAAEADTGSGGLLEERLQQVERREILAALQRCGGVATAAAEELGIGRSTLYRRMRALGLDE